MVKESLKPRSHQQNMFYVLNTHGLIFDQLIFLEGPGESSFGRCFSFFRGEGGGGERRRGKDIRS